METTGRSIGSRGTWSASNIGGSERPQRAVNQGHTHHQAKHQSSDIGTRSLSTEGPPTAYDQKDHRNDPAERRQGIHPSKNAEGELRHKIESLGGPKADPPNDDRTREQDEDGRLIVEPAEAAGAARSHRDDATERQQREHECRKQTSIHLLPVLGVGLDG